MKHRLLIVEPESELSEVLSLMFSGHFDVINAKNTKQAIKAIDENTPQIVLANYEQPDAPAIGIATHIEKISDVKKPALILLGKDVNDEAIKGAFLAGVADFVEKPFNVVAFYNRIIRFSVDLEHVKKLHANDKRKHNLAETAMKQSSAYGSGLDLLAKLNNVGTIDEFVKCVVKSFSSMNYHCAVEFRYRGQQYSLDADEGECHKNEERVFRLLHDKGRIYVFGRRIIFNDSHSSILVKNMPVQGTSSYDAAIDLFAKLIPALDARFVSLMNQVSMAESSTTLQQSIKMIKERLSMMEIERKDQQGEVANAINLSFHELELTEKQESFFLNLMDKYFDENKLNRTFASIIELIEEAAEKLELDIDPINTNIDDESSDDDMELF